MYRTTIGYAHQFLASNEGIGLVQVWLIIAVVAVVIYGLNKLALSRRGNTRGPSYKSQQARRLQGARFEQAVHAALAEHDPQAKMIVNGLFKRANAINTYFEIDILLISSKGIFVLELKDWQGYVFGELRQDRWVVGQLSHDRLLYSKEVYSPVMQNTRHIEDLQVLYPYDYTGYVIFSDRTQIGSGTHGVSTLEGFLQHYDALEPILDYEQIRHHAEQLSARVERGKEAEHIARIETNRRRFQ